MLLLVGVFFAEHAVACGLSCGKAKKACSRVPDLSHPVCVVIMHILEVALFEGLDWHFRPATLQHDNCPRVIPIDDVLLFRLLFHCTAQAQRHTHGTCYLDPACQIIHASGDVIV